MRRLSVMPLNILGALCLAIPMACASAQDAVIVAPYPPPPVLTEAVPDAVFGLAWQAGQWEWAETAYVWRAGHWVDANPGFTLSEAVWQRGAAGWEFIAPTWVR